MLFRIDKRHFITHAIDFFTLEELYAFQYMIISAKVPCSNRCTNCRKINDLYPDIETIEEYANTGDKSILEKMYFNMLDPKKGHDIGPGRYSILLYQCFVDPLEKHYNLMIVCDETENDYIDALCKYLKKKFYIEAIDLNELFTKGHVGPIYIDFDQIHDKAVDIRKAAVEEEKRTIAQTRDGKARIIETLSKKQKLKMLNKYGVTINQDNKKDINTILLEEWCADEEGDD